MSLGGLRRRRAGGLAAAALTILWVALPLPARAAGDIVAGLADSSGCALTLTLQFTAPVTLQSSAPPPAGNPYNLDGFGTCYGLGGSPLSLGATGVTEGMPSCATVLTNSGSGTLTFAGQSAPVTVWLTGATAAPQLVVPLTSSNVVAVAQLAITPSSLQACIQSGGTTVLQYTGIIVAAN